ncbi:hypothetical protein [Haloarchaeobius sp. TZWSO28]|uniref:hypothetical protein n=1 Tax=Haloarchaeobius sp. TZWSO28 TaxID=3446119 RepID=UPI003EBC2FA4
MATTALTDPSPAELRSRGRVLTGSLAAGQYQQVADAVVGPAAERITVAALRDAWETQTGPLGAFVGVTSTEHLVSEGYDVVLVEATFQQGLLFVAWTFDAGGVVGIWLTEPITN